MSLYNRTLSLLLTLALCTPAIATRIDLDTAFVSNAGTPILFDDFDDGVLGAPWLVLGGTPGPESGTVLEMQPDDFIFAPLASSSAFATVAVATMDLTDFSDGSAVSMLLTRSAPGGVLVLTLGPSFALFSNQSGPLGFVPLDPGSSATLTVITTATGIVTASVNDEPVFAGELPIGAASGIGFIVIPEPATWCLLGLGLFALLNNHRHRRGGRSKNEYRPA